MLGSGKAGRVVSSVLYLQQRTERHVFLTDGVCVCCKPKRGVSDEYRLKEKVNLRKARLVDMEDCEGTLSTWLAVPKHGSSSETKFAFLLGEKDQPGYLFFAVSKPEKNEWMASLTMLFTRR